MAGIITFSPEPSLFGFGALEKLPESLQSRGYRRILVFTDSKIAESGILERVLGLFRGSVEYEIFDNVPAEPKSEEIERQRERFDPDFDAIMGLGGGSAMDFAKAMAIIMAHGGAMGDYLGEGSVPGPVVPIICIPTTSGTGSQSTQTTVFTIDEVKRGVSSEYIRPALAIVDPGLTMGLPAAVTRNSGYDALMHSCESFLARPHEHVPERPILYQGSNPYSRSLALEAFRNIWQSYRAAVADGRNRKARAGMSIGSHMAGLAFSHSGLGLIHALASSLGGMIDAPHGVCLAACTGIGLRYNFDACEKDLAVLAGVIADHDGTSGIPSADGFLGHLQDLLKEFGFPTRPSELGIRKEDAKTVLKKTLVQIRRIQTNPRPLDHELLSYIEEGI